jgi:hypothetical protein
MREENQGRRNQFKKYMYTRDISKCWIHSFRMVMGIFHFFKRIVARIADQLSFQQQL